ncbi:MAG TPA: DUF2249 domain-containing protein [Polyangiaceae bacterium]|jgi:uncharacterized protein (DUF2249 family)|nr:DUF2249 domain-containing protein [Polyangiaceae bacterium]
MQQVLSASADPACRVVDLLEVCERRGLRGIELVSDRECDTPRVLEPQELAELASLMARHGCPVTGLYVDELEEICNLETARLSEAIGAPVVAPAGRVPLALLQDLESLYGAAHGQLLVSHRTVLEEASQLAQAIDDGRFEHIALAWEVRPREENLNGALAVLEHVRSHLRYVRLFGGGAEQRQMDGLGIGPLIVGLSRARYDGPLVLCPSNAAQRPLWSTWMQSSKSAGCGTAARIADERTSKRALDVRNVEPKDRLAAILGAYAELPRGIPLELTVDHDPSCMYFTLEATHSASSFSFDYLERGPDVWRVQVAKR